MGALSRTLKIRYNHTQYVLKVIVINKNKFMLSDIKTDSFLVALKAIPKKQSPLEFFSLIFVHFHTIEFTV